MKDLLRKDKLLILVLAFSTLMLYVASPDNQEIREVVWDFAFLMAAATAVGWILIEALDWVGYVAIGAPVGEPRRNVNGMSRDGLIMMAEKEGLAARDVLESLSDEDLLKLVAGHNGVVVKQKYGSSLIRYLLKFWYDIFYWIYLKLKALWNKLRGKSDVKPKKKAKRR